MLLNSTPHDSRCPCADAVLPEPYASTIARSQPTILLGGVLFADVSANQDDDGGKEEGQPTLDKWLSQPLGSTTADTAKTTPSDQPALTRAEVLLCAEQLPPSSFSLSQSPSPSKSFGGRAARRPLSGSRLRDLPRLLDDNGQFSGIMVHLGDCPHPISIVDVRLPTEEHRVPSSGGQTVLSDASSSSSSSSSSTLFAPSGGGTSCAQTFLGLKHRARCDICCLYVGSYHSVCDPLVRGDPGDGDQEKNLLLCEACHVALHYGASGELLAELKDREDFRVFPALPLGY